MAARLARQKATTNLIEKLLPHISFTESPHQSVCCLLCLGILKYPVQLTCGHRVCRSCYENEVTKKNIKYCPEDGELIENTFPDMSALTEIMNLACCCVSQSDGCEWRGLLLYLEDHVLTCEFTAKTPCPFSQMQCQFSGTKKTMNKHLMENSTNHDCLTSTCLLQIMNGSNDNRKIMDIVKEKNVAINKAITETNDKTMALQLRLEETSAILNGRHMKTNKCNDKLKTIEELLTASESKKKNFEDFHNRYKELVKKVDNQLNYVNELTEDKSNKSSKNNTKTLAGTKKMLIDKVKRSQEAKKQHEKQLADLSIKLRIFQYSSSDGNYTWKLDNLRGRFNDALSGKIDELYTPPLYTAAAGYKYSAKIMFYGPDKEQNARYLAFYIVIMQGDFDEILQFPFPYPIAITLLNTTHKANITHTLYPDSNKVHFQKPYANMNPAIGFSKFISHERLNSDGFIKDDSIFFKIVVDKSGQDQNIY